MLGNFSYCNPTKLYFGDEALQYLNEELPKYGKMWFWFMEVVLLKRMAFMMK